MNQIDSVGGRSMHMSNSRLAVLFASLAIGVVPQIVAAQSGPQVTPEIVAAAAAAKTPVAPGPVQPTWDSIRENYTVPQWFIDAKFGITMHWGLFSVAAYHNEWYERYMYTTFSQWHCEKVVYMYRSYHSLWYAATENSPQCMVMPNFASMNHCGTV